MNLFIILGILFLSLLIIVPLIERSNIRMSNESMAKMSKWFLPLIAIIAIAGLIKVML
ncbi:MAG: hypothetical protein AAGJ37_07750 [Pseudomonadota bacterium]